MSNASAEEILKSCLSIRRKPCNCGRCVVAWNQLRHTSSMLQHMRLPDGRPGEASPRLADRASASQQSTDNRWHVAQLT